MWYMRRVSALSPLRDTLRATAQQARFASGAHVAIATVGGPLEPEWGLTSRLATYAEAAATSADAYDGNETDSERITFCEDSIAALASQVELIRECVAAIAAQGHVKRIGKTTRAAVDACLGAQGTLIDAIEETRD